LDEKKFGTNIFLIENFFVAISFPREQFGGKNILVETFFGRKLFLAENFLLQNYFLRKILDEKNFGRNILWSKVLLLNIISSETR
jgi:hypothetical protein